MRSETIVQAWQDYYRPLLRYVRACGFQLCDAEDLVADVFTRLQGSLSAGFVIDEPRRWLFTVAHHLVIDQGKKRRRRACVLTPAMEDAVADDRALIDPVATQRDRLRLIRRVLRDLTPLQRVCVLGRLRGLALSEIAARAQCRPKRASEAIQRGLRHLQEAAGSAVRPSDRQRRQLRKVAA